MILHIMCKVTSPVLSRSHIFSKFQVLFKTILLELNLKVYSLVLALHVFYLGFFTEYVSTSLFASFLECYLFH